jgi:hypothetical protein
MGRVLQVRHSELGVVRAMKVVLPGGLNRAERFDREVRSLAKVRHPNVVAVHECGRLPDGSLYYVMDKVEGQTLREVILDRGRRPFGVALELAVGVARGVEALHAAGVVHRDLKPENVVLNQHGRPVVLDLGLAVDPETDERLTQTGTLMGTPAYMAPEQIDGRRDDVSPRIDVYALGLIVFEVFTGEPAVECDASHVELIGRILTTDRPTPTSVDPDLPLSLDAVCCRAMSRDPAQRYAHAGEFADALEGLSELSGRTRRQKRRQGAFAVAALAGVLGLVGTVLAVASPSDAVSPTVVPRRKPRRATRPSKPAFDARRLARAEKGVRTLRRLARSTDERAKVGATAEAWLSDFAGHPLEDEVRELARQAPYRAPLATLPLGLPSDADFGADGMLLDNGRKVMICFRKESWIVDLESRRRTEVELPGTVRVLGRLAGGDALAILARGAFRVDAEGGVEQLCALETLFYGLAISPDGTRIALGGEPPNAYVVDLKTGDTVQALGSHRSAVHDLCFFPDGKRVATVSGIAHLGTGQVKDCTLRIFDVATGGLLKEVKLFGRGCKVLATPDGQRLLAGDDLGRISVFETEGFTPVGALEGISNEATQVEHADLAHNQTVRMIRFSHDGQRIYTGAGGTRNSLAGNAFAVWDGSSRTELMRLPFPRRIFTYDVSPGSDDRGDRLLVMGRKDAEVWLLDPTLGEAK